MIELRIINIYAPYSYLAVNINDPLCRLKWEVEEWEQTKKRHPTSITWPRPESNGRYPLKSSTMMSKILDTDAFHTLPGLPFPILSPKYWGEELCPQHSCSHECKFITTRMYCPCNIFCSEAKLGQIKIKISRWVTTEPYWPEPGREKKKETPSANPWPSPKSNGDACCEVNGLRDDTQSVSYDLELVDRCQKCMQNWR